MAQAILVVEIDVAEHLAHEPLFLDADSMLTGEDTTSVERCPHDLCARSVDTLKRALHAGIKTRRG